MKKGRKLFKSISRFFLWTGKSYEADDVSQNAQRTELYRSRDKLNDLDNVAKSESPIIRILKKSSSAF